MFADASAIGTTVLQIKETYWIGCQRTGGVAEAVSREEFDMIAMAWRSLYAETVRARMENETLNLTQAVWTWARLTLSRVKAYGAKWVQIVCRSTPLAAEQIEGHPRGAPQIHANRVRAPRGLLHIVEATETIPRDTRRLTGGTPYTQPKTRFTFRSSE